MNAMCSSLTVILSQRTRRRMSGIGLQTAMLLSASGTGLAAPMTRVSDSLGPDSSLIAFDQNRDCVIDVVDVVWAIDTVMSTSIAYAGDQDGDGVLTANDRYTAIHRIVLSSYGDVTGDGVVNIDDVTLVLLTIGDDAPVSNTDVNLDGCVDVYDVVTALSKQGIDIAMQSVWGVVHDLDVYLEEFRSLGRSAFTFNLNCNAGPGRGPCDHTTGMSSTYLPGVHDLSLSSRFPANHLLEITQQWLADDATTVAIHGINISADKSWPPNHVIQASIGWGDHLGATSQRWSHAPGHSVSLSDQWPSTHGTTASRNYPPNHLHPQSMAADPSPHLVSVSLRWGQEHNPATSEHNVPVHGLSVSSRWPTNHESMISLTVSPGHQVVVSAQWPGNHIGTLSRSWPNSNPRWPANHSFSCSSSWESPPPPPDGGWPIFPPDHSWFTTATDLIP